MIVTVSVVGLFFAAVAGLKALLMVGGDRTVSWAVLLLAPAAPVSFDATPPLVFEYEPDAEAVTAIVMLQLPPDGMAPLVSRMPGLPATSAPPVLLVRLPLQVLLEVSGEAAVMAAGAIGNVSVKVTPLRGPA